MQTAPTKSRLLLVDGDPKSLRVLDVSLKKAGFQVATATSGIEALAAIQAGQPDLIISDTHMAGLDGFELCRRVKQHAEWAKIPFIFLSSRKSIEDKIRGLELGIEDYLTKPVYLKEITTRIRIALQRAQRERLESRREGRTRFTGQLADIGVVDLIQTLEINRKSGVIHVANKDRRRGEVYFREGRVIDAEVGRLSGAEALYRLFSWSDGVFEVEFKPIRRKEVIELSPPALLMEGMRRLDEWTRLLETVPPVETVFEVDYHLLADRLAELPDEVNGILRLFDGRRTLMQVIDDCDFPDLEALTIIGRLFAERLLVESAREARPNEPELSPRLERWLAEAPRVADAAPSAPAMAAAAAGSENDLADESSTPEQGEHFSAVGSGGTLLGFEPELAGVQRELDQLRSAADPSPLGAADATPAPAIDGRLAAAQEVGEGEGRHTTAPYPVTEAKADEGTTAGAAEETDSPAPSPMNGQNGRHVVAAAPSDAGSDDITQEMVSDAASEGSLAAIIAEGVGENPPAGEPLAFAPPPPVVASEPRREPVPEVPEHEPEPRASEQEEYYDDLAPRRRRRAVIYGALGVTAAVFVVVLATGLLKTEPAPRNSMAAPVAADSPPPTMKAAPAVELPGSAQTKPALPVAEEKGPAALPAPPAPAAAPPVTAKTEPAAAKTEPAVALAPTEGARPALVGDQAGKAVAPPSPEASRDACRKAYRDGHGKYKEVMAACPLALQANPEDAEVMVMLAHSELDRGNTAKALEWARKAVAVDATRADAYVFIGGAEQEGGKVKEARVAYRKYLELAPKGKYAGDLRLILQNL